MEDSILNYLDKKYVYLVVHITPYYKDVVGCYDDFNMAVMKWEDMTKLGYELYSEYYDEKTKLSSKNDLSMNYYHITVKNIVDLVKENC